MPDEAVELDERAGVEQPLDPLAREQLAACMLALGAFSPIGRAASAPSSARRRSFASVVSWDIAVVSSIAIRR